MKHIPHRLKRIRKTRIFTNRGSSLGNFQLKTKKSCCLSPWSSRCEAMPCFFAAGKVLHAHSCWRKQQQPALWLAGKSSQSCSHSQAPRGSGASLQGDTTNANDPPSVLELIRTKVLHLQAICLKLEIKAQPNSVTLHCWKRWSSVNPALPGCSSSPPPHGQLQQVPPARDSHK